jgi:large subunit ribosomal protein L2
VVAGGGRTEKPFMRAGTRFFKMKAKNKLWPKIGGSAQNAVDHPFGNKRTSRKSKARPMSRNAPPGRKVGMIAARRTGRKKK